MLRPAPRWAFRFINQPVRGLPRRSPSRPKRQPFRQRAFEKAAANPGSVRDLDLDTRAMACDSSRRNKAERTRAMNPDLLRQSRGVRAVLAATRGAPRLSGVSGARPQHRALPR